MINIIQVGLGPLGQKAVRYALERGTIRIVGAVDPAPDKVGQDLGALCGIKRRMDVVVRSNLNAALKGVKASVAVLTTVSSLKRLEPQVRELAEAGLNIVSTCEELSFPWKTQPWIAKRLDAICKQHGVACVGTGVNPGFLMDFLPCILTAVCQRVERIRIARFQDASPRRIPFQQKIGAGLTLAEFRTKVAAGSLSVTINQFPPPELLLVLPLLFHFLSVAIKSNLPFDQKNPKKVVTESSLNAMLIYLVSLLPMPTPKLLPYQSISIVNLVSSKPKSSSAIVSSSKIFPTKPLSPSTSLVKSVIRE